MEERNKKKCCFCIPALRPTTRGRREFSAFNVYMLLVVLFTIIIVVVPYVLDAEWEDPWDVDPNTGDRGDCEYVRENKLLRQRANAMSNAAYVSMGFYILLTGIYDILNTETLRCTYLPGNFRNRPEWTILLGLISMYEGIGSFALHASSGGSAIGRRLDFSGIYFIVCLVMCNFTYSALSAILSYILPRKQYSPNIDRILSMLFVIAFFSFVPFMWQYDKYIELDNDINESVKYLGVIVSAMGLFVFLDMIFLRFAHAVAINFPLLLWCGIGFGVAALLKYPQLALNGCESWKIDEHSWFQLHALWHGASAIGLLFLSQYKRSIGDKDLLSWQCDVSIKNIFSFFTFGWIPAIPLQIEDHNETSGVSEIDDDDNGGDDKIKTKHAKAAAVTPVSIV